MKKMSKVLIATCISLLPVGALLVKDTAALGCDFNRSMQHFVGKPLPSNNGVESKE
jgi:hypothetical protein